MSSLEVLLIGIIVLLIFTRKDKSINNFHSGGIHVKPKSKTPRDRTYPPAPIKKS